MRGGAVSPGIPAAGGSGIRRLFVSQEVSGIPGVSAAWRGRSRWAVLRAERGGGASSPGGEFADLSTDHRIDSRRGGRRVETRRMPSPAPRRPVPAVYARKRKRQKQPVPRDWRVASRREVLSGGMSSRALTAAVRAGSLIRARENVYVDPAADADCVAACAVGGQLTCVSELARWGVFVLDGSALHVAVPPTSARLRRGVRSVRVHWTLDRDDGWASVDIVAALVEAVRCQQVQAAVATLDSALHLRLIERTELDQVFAALPPRLRFLRSLLDPAAESGTESIMRLLLRRMGCRVDSQVVIRGVGRVDFLVDGWLIVECDSESHHASWEQVRRDRRRDQTAAALGLVTYRAIAEDVFWHQERVIAAVRGLRAARAAA